MFVVGEGKEGELDALMARVTMYAGTVLGCPRRSLITSDAHRVETRLLPAAPPVTKQQHATPFSSADLVLSYRPEKSEPRRSGLASLVDTELKLLLSTVKEGRVCLLSPNLSP